LETINRNWGATRQGGRVRDRLESMEDAGQKLKRVRERLNLRYRDVEEASLRIAKKRRNDEFAIALSRLADIENKGTVPTLYRMYSLCAIYRLDVLEVLEWYGINVSDLPADSSQVEIQRTHQVGFAAAGHGEVQVPLSLDPGLDPSKTTYFSRMVQRWGKLPLMFLNGLDLKNHRYAFIGNDDWSMHPILYPGSFILIDETKRKIAAGGWISEQDRPIYFLEHRNGFVCGWCSLESDRLIAQFHPSSMEKPIVFQYPEEVDVIGQITGLAMHLDPGKARRIRS
jgi:transcriptional regulator with XRE-family HTH domain